MYLLIDHSLSPLCWQVRLLHAVIYRSCSTHHVTLPLLRGAPNTSAKEKKEHRESYRYVFVHVLEVAHIISTHIPWPGFGQMIPP